jgi:parvulin-like peptidyl-prolyl isomerase
VSPQGKKGRPAPSADRSAGRKRLALAVFAVFVVGSFIVVAAAQGIGDPSVSDGDVAVVEDAPDGTITQEDLETALVQTAASQNLPKVPPPDDPQYDALADAALSDLILSRWVLGEAEERGIEPTERAIDQRLEGVIEQEFGSEKEFERFLEESGFTREGARERIALQLILDQIQRSVVPPGSEPEVSEDEIQTFYDENLSQFRQPEARDVRVILAKTSDDAEKALSQLEEDPSEKSFEQVAQELSVDEATQSTGGLREAVVEGQSEPVLDEQIFNAPEGELVGPFETDAGFYVIRVERIVPAETTQLDEVRDQIRQTLVSARQQEVTAAFQEDFQNKWVARTVCAEEYAIERCSNAPPPPNPCTKEIAENQGCDAPVPSTRPIQPGTAGVFGAPAAQGLPQGPITPQAAAPPGGALPPGLTPVPGAPPGTVPPGTVPPG